MPRKKRKTSTFKTNLKYEVYGISIIVLSLISLAGKGEIPGIGPVGRAFSSIFLLLTGEHYYMIPLILIYVGLYVMIKRKWPLTWSYRKTGLALIMVSLLITFHMILFEKMDPSGLLFTTGDILMQPYYNLSDYLAEAKSVNAFKLELGGGMIGALFFGLLHFLFDTLGATFVVIALFAIGFMCLTGISYVEMLRRLKPIMKHWRKQITRLMKQFSRWYKAKRRTKGKKSPAAASKNAGLAAEENEQDDLYPSDPIHNEDIAEEPLYSEAYPAEPYDAEPVLTVSEPNEKPVMDTFEADENSFIPLPPSVEQGQGHTLTFTKSESKPEAPYQLPTLHLLDKPNPTNRSKQGRNFRANAKKLEDTLESFGVKAKVIDVVSGPAVTRYEIQPDIGVKVSRIVNLTDDIALALAAKDIRMEAPIPGKAAIGIEVPNTSVSMVTLREVMESSYFQEASSKLTVALGRDIAGQPIVANLTKMPHLLVAGATGSGKSVCINGLITSILFKAKPDEVKFLMIDPKKVELNVYNGIPHLLAPVVTDPRRASLALKKVVSEMENRYENFSDSGTRNIEGYNEWLQKKGEEPLPYIVVIVDELADLMMVAANDVEDSITRLAQMARAAGIHLIIATQRPSVNVITGVIKANIPSRIAFGVSSQVDSRTILDGAGAEKLLGRGDMLFLPVGASKPHRIQGAFLSDQEVEAVVQFSKQQEEVKYQEEMVPEVEESDDGEAVVEDELFDQAVQIVVEARQASVSLLQRRMRVGYTRAARLIDSMEAKGIVGPYEGSKPREVLITSSDVQRQSAGL